MRPSRFAATTAMPQGPTWLAERLWDPHPEGVESVPLTLRPLKLRDTPQSSRPQPSGGHPRPRSRSGALVIRAFVRGLSDRDMEGPYTHFLAWMSEESRRRPEGIPRLPVERACLMLIFATFVTAAERWRGVRRRPKSLRALDSLHRDGIHGKQQVAAK